MITLLLGAIGCLLVAIGLGVIVCLWIDEVREERRRHRAMVRSAWRRE